MLNPGPFCSDRLYQLGCAVVVQFTLEGEKDANPFVTHIPSRLPSNTKPRRSVRPASQRHN